MTKLIRIGTLILAFLILSLSGSGCSNKPDKKPSGDAAPAKGEPKSEGAHKPLPPPP
jgi:hypothetical protein